MIRIASVALPKSPINLAQGDEIPQIITRITRQRPAEFLTTCAKRLLQQYLPEADIVQLAGRPRLEAAVDLRPQYGEVDGLGQQPGRAAFNGLPFGFGIA